MCKSSVCGKCGVVYDIDVTNTGPQKLRPVTTEDMTFVPCAQNNMPHTVAPLRYEMPLLIVTLQKDETFRARVIVRKGSNLQDAKWQHCTVALEEEPNVSIDEKQAAHLSSTHSEQLIAVCPMRVFGPTEKTGVTKVVKPKDCTECGECLNLCDKVFQIPNFVTITRNPNVFIITVRTNGMMDAADVVTQALDVVKKQEAHILSSMHPLAQLWKKIKPS